MSVILAEPPVRSRLGPIAAYFTLCLVWGSTFLAIRIAVETLPPWTMIGLRCAIAGMLLTAFAWLRGDRLPRGPALASAAVTGVLLFAGSQSLLSWGELRLPSGEAAVLVCTGSLFTPVATWLMGGSARPGGRAWAGLLVGFAGVAWLVRPEAGAAHGPGHFAASIGVLCSSLSWALGAGLAKRVPPGQAPLMGSGLQLLAGAMGALAIGGLRGEWAHLALAGISGRSLLAMAYLVIMGSLVAFVCFGWLVRIWRPEVLSTYGFVNPVVALVLGAVFAGEAVGAREVAATCVILCGVALVMLGNHGRRASPVPLAEA